MSYAARRAYWHRCFSGFVAFSCECRGYLEEVDGVGENALSLCELIHSVISMGY